MFADFNESKNGKNVFTYLALIPKLIYIQLLNKEQVNEKLQKRCKAKIGAGGAKTIFSQMNSNFA